MWKMEPVHQRIQGKGRGGREGGEQGQDEASSELGKEEDIDLSYSEKEEFQDGYYDDYVAKEKVEDKEGSLQG